MEGGYEAVCGSWSRAACGHYDRRRGYYAVTCTGETACFVITEIDISDPEGYGNEFVGKAQAIKAFGAKFLAIGGIGGAAKPITSLEGSPPNRVTIQQWDSVDALKAWYNGKDYQEALTVGRKYGTFRRYAVEGR